MNVHTVQVTSTVGNWTNYVENYTQVLLKIEEI